MVLALDDAWRRARVQHGLVTRHQAIAGGMTANQVDRLVAASAWERIHPGVYRLAGSPLSSEGNILAACFAAGPGSVASHQSAAWMWGLLGGRRSEAAPVVTVGRPTRRRPSGVVVHRARDLDPARTVRWRGVPCTDPLRTLVDLAAVCGRPGLDDAIDCALAARLVTVEGLAAELERLARRGRPGVGGLRHALAKRGYVGGPAPSVLESRMIRLLHRHGIRIAGREVKVFGGRYRLDFALSDHVAIEVDGQGYHSNPESTRGDGRRGNDLLLAHRYVLHYVWMDVLHDEDRIVREARQALGAYG